MSSGRAGLDNQDIVHAIEIRMRVSAVSPGGQLSITTAGEEKINLEEMIKGGDGFWMKTPVTAGTEMQTVTLTPAVHVVGRQLRHMIVKPTDQSGATFDIESVRIVFRKEHLASIASGVAWQGLKEVYRESIAARAPETATFTVRVPDNAWLDLAVGTIEDDPVTFRINTTVDGKPGDLLLERTITTPHRWERTPIDLAKFAGQTVTLACTLASASAGTLGFWGAPVIRVRTPAAAPAGGAPTASAPGRRPRGVILLQADTLRRDHLDAYGYDRETAPVLKKLAGEGTLFKNYTTQATWTKVSTPTLMTSLYPSSHGVADFADHLPAAANTLAESFRAAGYATLSLSSVLFTGQFTNLHQGFEELHEDGSVSTPGSSKTSREFVDRLATWLETHKDGPFFVFLHVFDPHDPYEPSAPYNTLWSDPAKKEEHEHQAKEVKKFIKDPLLQQFGMPARDELQKAGFDPDAYVGYDKGWYDGSIRAMDVEIARLFERLRGLGLEDDTLFAFLSDHGEEFLEHGRMFHGQTVYGELTQTPLDHAVAGRDAEGPGRGRCRADARRVPDAARTVRHRAAGRHSGAEPRAAPDRSGAVEEAAGDQRKAQDGVGRRSPAARHRILRHRRRRLEARAQYAAADRRAGIRAVRLQQGSAEQDRRRLPTPRHRRAIVEAARGMAADGQGRAAQAGLRDDEVAQSRAAPASAKSRLRALMM